MESLPDPKRDRVIKELEPPPAKPLSSNLLYPNGSTVPDWKALKQHIQKEGRLSKEHCLDLIRKVTDITRNEPNLLRLSAPITVVGDIHGQFYDMIKLLDVGGDPDTTQYLFLGDYVDRGSFSIEVLFLLYAIKLVRPKNIWLLRGNHECRQMTAFFNFRDECEYKFDLSVYSAFMDSFDTLPLAAVIDNKFFCLHGGLSPDLEILTQIGSINRFQEPPRSGLFCDLLWADPIDDEKSYVCYRGGDSYFPNDVRGCSFFFGYEAATKFLHRNHLLSVIRAHEAQLEGFKMHQTNTHSGFPTIITIFSAPNYCDCYNNKGAVLKFENNTLNIQQFNFSPHPFHLPNFMDAFTWSIPFVSERVTELLCAILNTTPEPQCDTVDENINENEENLDDIALPTEINFLLLFYNDKHKNSSDWNRKKRDRLPLDTSNPDEKLSPCSCKTTFSKERAATLRKKIQSVARLSRIIRTIRHQNQLILKVEGMTPGHRIPPEVLLSGERCLKSELLKSLDVKKIDSVNEERPEP